MVFEELNLNDKVLDALYDMHFEKCTPVQEKCIPEILEGKDVLGVAQTGTGKTAAYLLPVLSKLAGGTYPEAAINCLIMSPTRELAQQIDQAIQGFSYYLDKVSCVAVYGGNDGNRYDQELKSLSLGADLVIATPGRFISHMSLGNVDLSRVSFFILDEADRMLDMGFSDDIMTIAKKLPSTCQTIMFSATMPAKIEELANTLLKNPVTIKLAVSKPAEKIHQHAYVCHETQKMGIIKDIFKAGDLKRVIIFSGSKQKVKQIAQSLNQKQINCGQMHSDLEQAERDDMMFRFKSGQIDVLVATDILARGIDIDDISMVINYDVPHDAEDYVHRIGRTARADRDGEAITFVNEADMYFFRQIEKFLGREIEKTPLPEALGKGPDYDSEPGKPKRSGDAKTRRRKTREQQSHKDTKQRSRRNKAAATDQKQAAAQPTSEEKNEEKTESRSRSSRRRSSRGEKQQKPKQANGQNPKQGEEKTETRSRSSCRRASRNRKKSAQKPQAEQPRSTKYDIREEFSQPKKKHESGLKKLIKKPLRWLGLSKK